MSDYISKKKLISHIEAEYKSFGEDYDALQILGDIEDFPTEERQHGQWIFKNGKYRCSVCLEPCATFCMNEPRDRFCLWCGSDNGKKGEAE